MSTSLFETLAKLRNGAAIAQRLRWLEDRIYWVCELNRGDLIERFNISPQQASADISLYIHHAQNNLLYDAKKKQYIISNSFSAIFNKNWEEWLLGSSEDNFCLRSMPMTKITLPQRGINKNIIRDLLRSYKAKVPISIKYQSNKHPEPRQHTICPHNFVQTEIRWHVRAWDASRGRFTDIVLSRILGVEFDVSTEWVSSETDLAWNSWIDIILAPSTRLSESQRASIERDYQMLDGKKIISVRECLAYYYLAAMHLVDAVREHHGEPVEKNFGLAVANWEYLKRFV